MNDDKNRDWVEPAVRNALHREFQNPAIRNIEERIRFLTDEIRSHIPHQPPIAEDVRELAMKVVQDVLSDDYTLVAKIEFATHLIQSFLTSHTAEQQNIGSQLMAEQIAQSYLTGAGRFSFEKDGDANWQINKMLDEIESMKRRKYD